MSKPTYGETSIGRMNRQHQERTFCPQGKYAKKREPSALDVLELISELPDLWRARENSENKFVSGYSCAADLDALLDARIAALLGEDDD